MESCHIIEVEQEQPAAPRAPAFSGWHVAELVVSSSSRQRRRVGRGWRSTSRRVWRPCRSERTGGGGCISCSSLRAHALSAARGSSCKLRRKSTAPERASPTAWPRFCGLHSGGHRTAGKFRVDGTPGFWRIRPGEGGGRRRYGHDEGAELVGVRSGGGHGMEREPDPAAGHRGGAVAARIWWRGASGGWDPVARTAGGGPIWAVAHRR